jgi:two-component system LytT family response regulator
VEKKLTAIIVDDEQSARDVLNNLIERFCPQIEIIEKCTDVIKAVAAIKRHQPDLVFLDIEMPNYAGYEIVSFFDSIDFEIVFVTAYDKYAIKAFEVSAVDYLLKPVEIVRLKETIDKLVKKTELKETQQNYKVLTENLKSNTVSKIVVRHSDGQKIIATTDIIAIEANEAYSFIHTTTGRFIKSKNLKYFESVLNENSTFLRTHKSWIINLSHLIKFSKSNLEIELVSGITAKLSKYKMAEFEEFIMK